MQREVVVILLPANLRTNVYFIKSPIINGLQNGRLVDSKEIATFATIYRNKNGEGVKVNVLQTAAGNGVVFLNNMDSVMVTKMGKNTKDIII